MASTTMGAIAETETKERSLSLGQVRELLLRVLEVLPREDYVLIRDVEATVAELAADPLLTTGEAADRLGVRSLNTIKAWARAGSFPGARRTPGGRWRIPESDVHRVAGNMAAIADLRARGTLDLPDSGASLSDDAPDL